jgi:hypothetical protein
MKRDKAVGILCIVLNLLLCMAGVSCIAACDGDGRDGDGAGGHVPFEGEAAFGQTLRALAETPAPRPSVWKLDGAVFFTSSEAGRTDVSSVRDGSNAQCVVEDVSSVAHRGAVLYYSRDWVQYGVWYERHCVLFMRDAEGKETELFRGEYPVRILCAGERLLYFVAYARNDDDVLMPTLYAMEPGSGQVRKIASANTFPIGQEHDGKLYFATIHLLGCDGQGTEEAGRDYHAYAYEPDAGALAECTSVADLALLSPATMRDGWVYFYGRDEGMVYRVSVVGTRTEEVLRVGAVQEFSFHESNMVLAVPSNVLGYTDVYVFSEKDKTQTKILQGILADTTNILDGRLYYDSSRGSAPKPSVPVGGGTSP